MSTDSDNALLTAIQIASAEAAARVQAATVESSNAAGATRDAANSQKAADEYVADRQLDGVKYQSDHEGVFAVQLANTRGGYEVQVANIQKSAATSVAETNKDSAEKVEQIRQATEEQVAVTHADAQTTVATTQAEAQRDVAKTESDAHVQSATVQVGGVFFQAETESTWRQAVAVTDKDGTIGAATLVYDGVLAHEQGESSRLASKLNFAVAVLNDVLPLIDKGINAIQGVASGTTSGSGTIGFRALLEGGPISTDDFSLGHYARRTMGFRADPLVMSTGGGGGSGGGTGTATTDYFGAVPPFISSSGVYSPAQLQAQINRAVARNDARTASQLREVQGDIAGRGFSANAPILDVLRVSLAAQNLRANVEAETTIRNESSKLNADAVYNGQVAQNTQFNQQQKVLLEADANTTTRIVGILNAISSLVGGII